MYMAFVLYFRTLKLDLLQAYGMQIELALEAMIGKNKQLRCILVIVVHNISARLYLKAA